MLDNEQVKNLNNHVRGKSHEDVAAWHRSLGARDGFENIQADLSLGTYLPAYETAVKSIISELGDVDEGVVSAIRHRPIYVGTNSLAFNCQHKDLSDLAVSSPIVSAREFGQKGL